MSDDDLRDFERALLDLKDRAKLKRQALEEDLVRRYEADLESFLNAQQEHNKAIIATYQRDLEHKIQKLMPLLQRRDALRRDLLLLKDEFEGRLKAFLG